METTWNRLLGSFSGQHRERDLGGELDAHIQLLTGEIIRRGLPRDEAHRRGVLTAAAPCSTGWSTGGYRFHSLTARGETPAAFGRRCIPAHCVAPRSNIAHILGRRALSAGRLAALGATLDFHHGLFRAARTFAYSLS
jgi:hypothetical protein